MFLSQKFAQPHFAAVKAARLLQYVSLTFAHVETKIFDHPYLQNTDTQAEAQSFKSNFDSKSCHRFSTELKSLWF